MGNDYIEALIKKLRTLPVPLEPRGKPKRRTAHNP